MTRYRVIDADGHVMEPPDLWEKRLPPELRERVPKVEGFGFVYGGRRYPRLDVPAHLEAAVAAFQNAALDRHYKEYRDAGWSPASQVKALDRMGVEISFLYPTRGLNIWAVEEMDAPLAAALARAYNDWVAEFAAYCPERLRPVAGLSLHDPALALAELRRVVVDLGIRAIYLRPNPLHGRLLSDPAYAPLWDACEALGVAVGIHEGAYTLLPAAGADRFKSRFALHACSHPMEQMMAFLALLEGGVLERHPRLRFAFLESGCGWLPYWLWRLDELEYKNLGMVVAETVKRKPSEYFRRQCYISCEPEEPYLSALIEYIGEDNLLFASDYPHPDHSPDILEDILALEGAVSPRVVQKVLWDNPRAFYGLEEPDA